LSEEEAVGMSRYWRERENGKAEGEEIINRKVRGD